MKRFRLNLCMFILLLLIMGFHYLPKTIHEILGLVLLAGALLHLKLNWKWFTSFTKGKWNKLRLLQTLSAILLVVAFLTAVTTGIIVSNHVFRDLWQGSALHKSVFIHQLHGTSSYLMVILAGLHIGRHWQGLWYYLKKLPFLGKLDKHPQLGFWLAVVIGWAGCAFARLDHVGDRLLLQHIFGTLAAKLPGLAYLLLLTCMMGLYAGLFYLIQKKLQPENSKIPQQRQS